MKCANTSCGWHGSEACRLFPGRSALKCRKYVNPRKTQTKKETK